MKTEKEIIKEKFYKGEIDFATAKRQFEKLIEGLKGEKLKNEN